MEVTDVKIRPIDAEQLRAIVTITLDNSFVVRDIKIIRDPPATSCRCLVEESTTAPIKTLCIALRVKREKNETRRMLEAESFQNTRRR
jgi:hypothetical protein